MTYYSDVVSNDKKLTMLKAIDFCRIAQLVEHFNGAQLKPDLFFFHAVEVERNSYDDCFQAVDFFLNETGIGSYEGAQYDAGFFSVELYTVNNLFSKLHLLSKESADICKEYFQNWMASLSGPVSWNNELNLLNIHFAISYELEELFHWYPICSELLELEYFCREYLKEIIEHE